MTASYPVFKPVSLPDFQNGDDRGQREALHCSFIDRIRALLNQQDTQKDLDNAREQIRRMRFDLEG